MKIIGVTVGTTYNPNKIKEDIVEPTFDETSTKSASQKATAEWVTALIDEAIAEGEW